jgi:hypothetical protein
MRILVADQNALLLAAIAATFGRHCEIVTATRRDVCMAHLAQRHFDVVVACEKLAGGYTGLELLSEVESVSPTTLRIFAARPETLKRLGKQLDFFGLLGTLHYPIEARKLLVGLKVARSKLPGRPKPPKVKHVVLENEWDTGERLALLGQELEDAPEVKQVPAAAENAAVEQARHIAEASSFEVSFEVSFDENPSRYDVTGHGHDGTPPIAGELFPEEASPPEAVAPLEVSFDENPNPVAVASKEPFKEAPSPAAAPAEETAPYFDDSAANDEVFSGEPAAPQAHGDTTRGKTPAAAGAGSPRETSAAAQRPTAYAPASAQAQRTTSHASPSAAQTSTRTAAASKPAAAKAEPTRQSGPKGPRPRKPTVPSAAQREAFQRALARRNAARAGGFVEEPPIDFSAMGSMSATRPAQTPAGSSQSLSALARMATTKRPLPGNRSAAKGIPRSATGATWGITRRAGLATQPKRRVVVVGSGIAAVLLVAVVCFELLRTTSSSDPGRHGRAARVQLFSPPASTYVADNSAGSPQVFTPAPPEPVATPAQGTDSALPQPQTFNPDTAPPDPPPPPALERPGPMEPPSFGHGAGPPPGMQGGSD